MGNLCCSISPPINFGHRRTGNTTPFRVLVFSKTAGYRHDCIPTAIASLTALSEKHSFISVTASEDATLFSPTTLSKFAVIVLLHTSGDFLDGSQLDAFKSYVRNGGGVVGIHCAASGMPSSEWYGRLIGAQFDMHPPYEPGTVLVDEKSQNHFILNGKGGKEGRTDEWYNFKTHPRDNKNLKILLKGDTKSFKGSKMGDDHPLAWCQEFEGGRSFYTGLGHFDAAYAEEWYMDQILRAILWTARRENSVAK
jgi:type 1 glutamine amidotransferase